MLTRKDIFNILFWVFLVIGVVLLLWYIFGDSPTELSIIAPFILASILKTLGVSDDLKDFKHEVRMSFHKLKNDINGIKTDFDKLKTKK